MKRPMTLVATLYGLVPVVFGQGLSVSAVARERTGCAGALSADCSPFLRGLVVRSGDPG